MGIDIVGTITSSIYSFFDALFFQPISQAFGYLTSALYLPMPSFGSSSDVFTGILTLLLIFYLIYRLSSLLIKSAVIGAILTLSVVFLNSHFQFGMLFDYIALLRIFFVGFFGFIVYKMVRFLRSAYQQVDKPAIYIYEVVKTRLSEDLAGLSRKYGELKEGKKQEQQCLTNAEIEELCRQKYCMSDSQSENDKPKINFDSQGEVVKDKKRSKLSKLGVRRIDE
ncbi:MAG: hypothetical protein CVT89_04990 [Candidatus Altiarchaeales archaeon HGW-Altiarchaeales-2]|nr:MAG: hypothetical protein CVT89_04990 [Candidatus Altiarchaeales archaeon HGW-Altiarchaeales-2]